MDWESDKHVPEARYFATLIRVLGGEPWPPPSTLAERLIAERRRRGLTQKEAAAVMHVNGASLWSWECGRRTPRFNDAKAKIEAFLAGRPRPTLAGIARRRTRRFPER
jgi:DNA-binding XRE family transcriptional regulator